MNKKSIALLPEALSNMIAAGEVVERPLSVVKELVENSIDADSSIIKIELLEAGLKKITITDNGYGMTKDEIPLALVRHATSKISTTNDLFNIATLGFRGEALPAIASVSDLKIASCTNSHNGYQYSYQAGKLISSTPFAMAIGTQIEVSNLFYNTPARFKHLGKMPLELSHITNFINRLIIAFPHIAFTLTNNDKTIIQTDGKSNIELIISETYGKDVAKNLLYFENQNELYLIKGYTTTNAINRSNKNGINLIINGRVIKNPSLIYAITDAYQTILPIGKYPVTILEIICDASLIDVNVHPSKLEIRFTDEYNLKRLITNTIYATLNRKELIIDQLVLDEIVKPYKPVITAPSAPENTNNEEIPTEKLWDMFDTYNENDQLVPKQPIIKEELIIKEEPTNDSLIKDRPSEFFKHLIYLGQYLKTYLLLQGDEDLYLLDQHAAMERCKYEELLSLLNEPNNDTYELLIPLSVDFNLHEVPLIINKSNELKDLGIEIEEFGGPTILVRKIPTWIPKNLELEFIHDICNHLINEKKVSRTIMYDSLAKTLSCKKSIKANMSISDLEVQELLNKLDKCKMPYTCPHGRPTIIKFTHYEIEKMFKRVI